MVSQDPAPCTNLLGFTSVNYGYVLTNHAVSVNTLTGCVITALSGTNWITVGSIASNTPASSTVSYTVAANPTHLTRTGLVFIGNQTLTVTQDSAPCTNTLGFNSINYVYVLT